MKLNAFTKALWGFFSLLPYIIVILVLIFVGEEGTKNPYWVSLGIVTFSSIPVMLILTFINAVRNKHFSKNQRQNWIIFLVFINILAIPIYWYLHILHEPQQEPAPSTSPDPNWAGRTKRLKVALLSASLAPLLFFATTIILFMYSDTTIDTAHFFGWLYLIGVVGLTIFYIVDAQKNRNVDLGQRVLWILLLIFSNIVIFPVYWYLYIWREPKPAQLKGNT